MNLYIEQPKGSNIVVIELPKEHITRKETCPYCSQHLVETFAQKSDRPKDPMKVLYGHRYALWWESLKIFCLNCRTVFTHQPSQSVRD